MFGIRAPAPRPHLAALLRPWRSDGSLNEFLALPPVGYKYDPSVQKLTSTGKFRYADVVAPASINWVEKGAVTPVKSQACANSHIAKLTYARQMMSSWFTTFAPF